MYLGVYMRTDVLLASNACFSQGAPGPPGYPGAAGAMGPSVSIKQITFNNRLDVLCFILSSISRVMMETQGLSDHREHLEKRLEHWYCLIFTGRQQPFRTP